MAESEPTNSYQSKLDDALSIMDHVADRVTISAMTGLGCGAVYSTLKGLPIPKTSLSVAMSCALISTACFGMERLAYGVIQQTKYVGNESIKSIDGKNAPRSADNYAIYGSHALGGFLGGGIAGFLFQAKPFAGAILLTPLMLVVGKVEVSIKNYRMERLQQLIEQSKKENESS